jgi:hypothetical protein
MLKPPADLVMQVQDSTTATFPAGTPRISMTIAWPALIAMMLSLWRQGTSAIYLRQHLISRLHLRFAVILTTQGHRALLHQFRLVTSWVFVMEAEIGSSTATVFTIRDTEFTKVPFINRRGVWHTPCSDQQ